MPQQNIPAGSPALRIELDSKQDYSLDKEDLYKVFSYYGDVLMITPQGKSAAVIYFKNIVSAFLAQQSLNQVYIEPLASKLIVKWYIPTEDLIEEKQEFSETSAIDQSQKEGKYTCRFDIQIENEKEFQVAKRIIGSKGAHMKNIIELCSSGMKYGKESIKLRLRGKGSGFKEGPQKQGMIIIRI
jgi:hypothetical protein